MMRPPDDDTRPAPPDRLHALESENRQLQERLRQAELLLDIHDMTRQYYGASHHPEGPTHP